MHHHDADSCHSYTDRFLSSRLQTSCLSLLYTSRHALTFPTAHVAEYWRRWVFFSNDFLPFFPPFLYDDLKSFKLEYLRASWSSVAFIYVHLNNIQYFYLTLLLHKARGWPYLINSCELRIKKISIGWMVGCWSPYVSKSCKLLTLCFLWWYIGVTAWTNSDDNSTAVFFEIFWSFLSFCGISLFLTLTWSLH